MAFDYAEMAAVSQSLISEFGRDLTFVELGDVAGTPSQPWKGATSPRGAPKQTLVLKGVFVPPSSLDTLGRTDTADDFLKRSSQIALVYSKAVLEPFDEILESSGDRWKIQGLERLRPGTIDLLWFVGVSR